MLTRVQADATPGDDVSNPRWASQLTRRQRLFVDEYLVDLNGTQAAIRAGYGKAGAAVEAHRLLRNPKVAAAVDAALAERPGATRARIVDELAAIAFADPRDVMSWDGTSITVKPSAELTNQQARVIAEVSQTPTGTRIRLCDKQGALEKLGKALRMFTDRVEHEGGGGGDLAALLREIDGKSRGVPPKA